MVKELVNDKNFRQKAEFWMSIVRTVAAIAAATTLVVKNWHL